MNYSLLKNKKVLLCVSSGIAIYKAIDLCSRLRKNEVDLTVLMTKDAEKLISKTVFQAVGKCKVYTDIYELEGGWIPHTDLSLEADVLIVAPATSNTIAKITAGISDNLVTAACLAFNKKERIIVPTMNIRMYENEITQSNIITLKKRGWFVMEPEEGHLACGEVGKGRYPENENILDFVEYAIANKDFKGKKVLITAGPTIEEIDPVRYISNYSSGKMGYEIAREFSKRGADVSLISGKTHLKLPYMVKDFVEVKSTENMFEAVIERVKEMDIIVLSAAVSDFVPVDKESEKIKKDKKEDFDLKLKKNTDIAFEISKIKKDNQIVVGFAAETNDLIVNAKNKLNKKKFDIIVANDVSRKDIGFSSDFNEINVITKEDEYNFEKSSKKVISSNICDFISSYLDK